MSGVSLIAYWLSNFVIDYAKFLICGGFACLAMVMFDIKTFTKKEPYPVVWVLTLLYGIAMILFTYVTSFAFRSPSAA